MSTHVLCFDLWTFLQHGVECPGQDGFRDRFVVAVVACSVSLKVIKNVGGA